MASVDGDNSEGSIPDDAPENLAGEQEPGVAIPIAPQHDIVHHQVVLLPGMPGFDDFDDEDGDEVDLDEDYYDDELDDEDLMNWALIQHGISGDEISVDEYMEEYGDDSDFSSDDSDISYDGAPRLHGPVLLDPSSLERYPLRSSESHRQVADALCCDGSQGVAGAAAAGEYEVMMYCRDVIEIYRFSPDGKNPKVVFSYKIKPFEADIFHQLAHGHLLRQRVKPFSIARTEDGRFLAVAVDIGFVFLIEIEEGTPSSASRNSNDPTSQAQEPNMGAASSKETGQEEKSGMYRTKKEHVFVMSDLAEMANSVRFGLIGGKLRLMVGCQSRYVAFFELPDDQLRLPVVASLSSNQADDPKELSSEDRSRGAIDVLHLTDQYVPDTRVETAAIGPFLAAVNYVESSKDGRYLAVCLDLGCLYLLDEKTNYKLSSGRLLNYDGEEDMGQRGNHYCSFSPSGDNLVATSDRVHGAMVWSTKSAELLFTISTARPSLPVSFIDDRIFAFAQEEKKAHVVDIGFHERAHQIVKVPPMEEPLLGRSRITGLSTMDGKLLISTLDQVFSYQCLPSQKWSRSIHQRCPKPFKDVVRTMILGASADPQCDLYRLAPANIEQIIALASYPFAMWFPPKEAQKDVQSLRISETP